MKVVDVLCGDDGRWTVQVVGEPGEFEGADALRAALRNDQELFRLAGMTTKDANGLRRFLDAQPAAYGEGYSFTGPDGSAVHFTSKSNRDDAPVA